MPVDLLSKAFAALGDPIRRDLVARLATGDQRVGALALSQTVTKQAVSKHLRVLEEAGLVSRTGDAYHKSVHLEPKVFDLMTAWIDRYARAVEARFERLEELITPVTDNVSASDHDRQDPRDSEDTS